MTDFKQHQTNNDVFYQPPAGGPPLPPGTAVVWMQRPQQIPGCPPGLEYLTQVDSLMVAQVPSIIEAVIGWERNNKYAISNNAGQQVYYAVEETDTCMRVFCEAQRGFQIFIFDNLNQRIMRISRELKCCAGCSWCAGCCYCCSHEILIEAPIGNVIGYVKQKGSFWKAAYDICDEAHTVVLKVRGPCCVIDGPCCPCENEFKLLTADGQNQIGKISKVYGGFVNEMFTTADKFTIQCPLDLSVKVKAILLGALFLIVKFFL